MPLLHHLMHCVQRLERLDLVRLDRLHLDAIPEGLRVLMVPGIYDASADMLSLGCCLFDRSGLANVRSKLSFRLAHVDIARLRGIHVAGAWDVLGSRRSVGRVDRERCGSQFGERAMD